MQYLPLIIFVIFLFFPSGSGSTSYNNHFSLDRTNSHTTERLSKDDIRYYVQPHFNGYYGNNRIIVNAVEDLVLNKYAERLDSRCRAQMNDRDAKMKRDRKEFVRASESKEGHYSLMPMPDCDKLDELRRKFRSRL